MPAGTGGHGDHGRPRSSIAIAIDDDLEDRDPVFEVLDLAGFERRA